jgi:hypothetical protein
MMAKRKRAVTTTTGDDREITLVRPVSAWESRPNTARPYLDLRPLVNEAGALKCQKVRDACALLTTLAIHAERLHAYAFSFHGRYQGKPTEMARDREYQSVSTEFLVMNRICARIANGIGDNAPPVITLLTPAPKKNGARTRRKAKAKRKPKRAK